MGYADTFSSRWEEIEKVAVLNIGANKEHHSKFS